MSATHLYCIFCHKFNLRSYEIRNHFPANSYLSHIIHLSEKPLEYVPLSFLSCHLWSYACKVGCQADFSWPYEHNFGEISNKKPPHRTVFGVLSIFCHQDTKGIPVFLSKDSKASGTYFR